MIALNSAIAATANKAYLAKRYENISSINAPVAVESLPSKMKDFLSMIKSIFGDNAYSLVKTKAVRAGKVKNRGRRFKQNAGLLVVKAENEKQSFKGIDMRSVNELSISDLYPLGRITLYTASALKEMEAKK